MAAAAAAEGGRRLDRAELLCFCVWEKSACEQLLSRGRLRALLFARMSTFFVFVSKKVLASAFFSSDKNAPKFSTETVREK